MTEVDLLTEISGKLDQILSKWEWLQTAWDKARHVIATPAGEFFFLGHITYGEFLLAVLLLAWAGMWFVRKAQELLSPGGWW